MNCTGCNTPLVAGSEFCGSCGLRVKPPGAPPMKAKRSALPWVLLMVVFAGLGILIVAALPNLLAERSHQRRKATIESMKSLSTALAKFHTEHHHYPAASDMAALCRNLAPAYLTDCIQADAWSSGSTPSGFHYQAWDGSPPECGAASSAPDQADCSARHYGLASGGRDGRLDHPDLREYVKRENLKFDDDLVLRDGEFIQAPAAGADDGPSD